jgi:hypothetical protein
MKIYEKPMAIIEKINVEDVITASALKLTSENSTMNDKGTALAGADDLGTIVFEW